MALITDGLSSYGAKLYHGQTDATAGQANNTNMTLVGGVFSVRGPSFAQSSVETTDLNSANRFRTFKPGMADGGEVTFDIRYNPNNDTHDATVQDASVGGGILDNFGGTTSLPAVNRVFCVEFPDTTADVGPTTSRSKFVFEGHYTRFEPSIDIDSAINASCSIKISGKPTFTQGTGT